MPRDQKKAVDAFDLERYILQRNSGTGTGTLSLPRCDRTEAKASEYGKNDGSFDIQHFLAFEFVNYGLNGLLSCSSARKSAYSSSKYLSE